MHDGYPCSLLPDYASAMETTALDGLDTSRPVLLELAQGIRLDPREDLSFSEALLLTSDAAYSKAAGYQMTTTDREEGDADGPFALAAYACQQDTGAGGRYPNRLRGNESPRSCLSDRPRQRRFFAGLCLLSGGQTSGVDPLQGIGSSAASDRWAIDRRAWHPVRAGIAGSYIDSGRCSAGAAPQKVNAYGGPQKDLAGAAGWCAVGRCGAVG